MFHIRDRLMCTGRVCNFGLANFQFIQNKQLTSFRVQKGIRFTRITTLFYYHFSGRWKMAQKYELRTDLPFYYYFFFMRTRYQSHPTVKTAVIHNK